MISMLSQDIHIICNSCQISIKVLFVKYKNVHYNIQKGKNKCGGNS